MKKFALLLIIVFLSSYNNVYSKDLSGQKVVKQGDNIFISFRFRENTDLHLEIGRCGVNDILNIKAIYLDPNYTNEVSPWVSNRAILCMQSCTDWIGPYMVQSLEDEDSPSSFTGGWHGSNGDGTGFPTARTDNIKVTINEHELLDNVVYEGDVSIIAENYIKAYNTISLDKDVLKEVVNYTVIAGKVEVKVQSTALNNIAIYNYYGLQTQNISNQGVVNYGNGLSAKLGKYSDCGKKADGNLVDTFTINPANSNCSIIAHIEPNVGLATFDNIFDDEPTIFTESHGKTYFNLINGKEKDLSTNEFIYWNGFYRFE